MSRNIIVTEFSLALRAGLTDADMTRVIEAGSGGWLRGIAKRVESGRLSESVAVSLILASAEAVSLSSKVPVPILLTLNLWSKALKSTRRVYAS